MCWSSELPTTISMYIVLLMAKKTDYPSIRRTGSWLPFPTDPRKINGTSILTDTGTTDRDYPTQHLILRNSECLIILIPILSSMRRLPESSIKSKSIAV